MEPSDSQYDYDSTIFSPDGRLFQVEYARETIKRGSTTIALKYKDGIVILTYKNINSNLIDYSSIEKISQIEKNIICTYIGLSADARHLVEYSQEIAAYHKILYGEQISIKGLVEEICSYKHIFTTFAGLRPFGLVLIVAGIDSTGIRLFSTEPSGSFLEHKAFCEGEKNKNILKYLNKFYTENLTLDKGIKLAYNSIKKTFKNIKIKGVELGIIDRNKMFYKLTRKDIEKIVK